METKIQSSSGGIIPAMLIASVLALLLPASFQSCRRDVFVGQDGPVLKKAVLPFEDPALYWGQAFTRGKGKPLTEVVKVNGADLVNFDGCLHLVVKIPENKLPRVESAVITIDGEQMVSPGDFNDKASVITKEICGKKGDFTIGVQLHGEPGSKAEVRIEGIMKNPVTDTRDGHVYHWVKIGNQRWMTENLAYLPIINLPADCSKINRRYYVYGYWGADVAEAKATPNYAKYGVMYNIPAVLDGAIPRDSIPSGIRGVSPQGWHIPSWKEWMVLREYLGENGYGDGNKYYIAKALASRSGWVSSEIPGTVGYEPETNNSTGFSALPGGVCYSEVDIFYRGGYRGQMWSASEMAEHTPLPPGTTIYYMNIGIESGRNYVSSYGTVKWAGMSVRCIRDY